MNIKMNDTEYNSLRAEIIARIQTITTLDNSVLIATVSIWLVVLAINRNFFAGLDNGFLTKMLQLIILGVSIIIIYIASIKNYENVNQITALSAYIKVFYEYAGLNQNTENDISIYYWETAQVRTVFFKKDEKSRFFLTKVFGFLYRILYNGSYLFLEIASTTIFYIVLWDSEYPLLAKIIVSAATGILILIITLRIITLTFVDTFSNKKQKRVLAVYVAQAKEIGLIGTEKTVDEIVMHIMQINN